MRPILVMLLVEVLAGCEAPASPPPPPLPAPITLCVVDAGMTEPAAPPAKPSGAYTQRDVGIYLEQLWAWGNAAWTRVAGIRKWSDDCDRRAGSRESE